jgi:hypothetical protein
VSKAKTLKKAGKKVADEVERILDYSKKTPDPPTRTIDYSKFAEPVWGGQNPKRVKEHLDKRTKEQMDLNRKMAVGAVLSALGVGGSSEDAEALPGVSKLAKKLKSDGVAPQDIIDAVSSRSARGTKEAIEGWSKDYGIAAAEGLAFLPVLAADRALTQDEETPATAKLLDTIAAHKEEYESPKAPERPAGPSITEAPHDPDAVAQTKEILGKVMFGERESPSKWPRDRKSELRRIVEGMYYSDLVPGSSEDVALSMGAGAPKLTAKAGKKLGKHLEKAIQGAEEQVKKLVGKSDPASVSARIELEEAVDDLKHRKKQTEWAGQGWNRPDSPRPRQSREGRGFSMNPRRLQEKFDQQDAYEQMAEEVAEHNDQLLPSTMEAEIPKTLKDISPDARKKLLKEFPDWPHDARKDERTNLLMMFKKGGGFTRPRRKK